MTIPRDLIQLHEGLIVFGVKVQQKSSNKMEKRHHIEDHVYMAFYRLIVYGITLHRAILSLCQEGWTHITPILIRTLMDCSVNCLAIVKNELPEYMAFKYLYSSYIKVRNDNNAFKSIKEKATIDLDTGIDHIKNPSVKNKAIEFINKGKIGAYWFNPEEKSPGAVVEHYGSHELKFQYHSFSMSVHGTHLGLFLFKDNPDEIDTNPCENPRSTKNAIIISSRHLLELINIRNEYEQLGFDLAYKSLQAKVLAFKDE